MAQIITKVPYGENILYPDTALITGHLWDNRVNQTTKIEDWLEIYARIVEMNYAFQHGFDLKEAGVPGEDIDMPAMELWPYYNSYLDWFLGVASIDPETEVTTTTWQEYEGQALETDTELDMYDKISGWVAGELETDQFYGKHMISGVPFWTCMHDHMLDITRKYAVGGPLSTSIENYWLDEDVTVADTDALSIATITWADTNQEVIGDITWHEWDFTITNAYSEILTTDTRIPNPDEATFVTIPSSDNTPFASKFYPDAPISPTSIYSPSGNWWTYRGFGEEAYKLWPEFITGYDSTIVTVSAEQSGFSIDESVFEFKVGSEEYQSFSVSNSTTDYTELRSSLIKATSPGKDDVYAVASDYIDSGLNLDITFSNQSLSIPAGDSSTITLTLKTNPHKTTIAHFTTIGSDIGLGGTALYFLSTSWDTPKTMTVYANNRTGPSAGIINIVYEGKTYMIPVRITDTATNDIILSPTLLPVNKGSSSNMQVYIEAQEDDKHEHGWDKRLHTKTYENIRDILKKLNRTVTWVDPSECLVDTLRKNTWSSSGSEDDLTSAQLWAQAYTDATNDTDVTTTDDEFNPVLYESNTVTDRDSLTTTPPGETVVSGNFSLSVSSAENTGITLPYPSATALDSGLITGVSIYAVSRGLVPDSPDESVISPATKTATVSNNGMDAYDDIDFSLVTLSTHEETLNLNFDATNRYTIPGDANEAISEYTLELMASGTTLADLKFNLGTSILINPGFSNSTSVQYDYHAEFSNGTVQDRVWQDNYIDQKIEILGFLVVVDWGWDHFPETGTFSPTLNDSPLWTKAQSDSNWQDKYTQV